jgi:glycosyltransferase involved in cell wall biosynthesis
MSRLLVINEMCWPEGSGAELATHLILKLLEPERNDIIVLTGTKLALCPRGIKYLYSPLLNVPTKIHLWKNLAILSQMNWFIKLLKQTDMLYITRFAYPVIPLAKKYGKKVIVHLHNYQPISYHATVDYPYERKYSRKLLDQIKGCVRYGSSENGSVYRTFLSSLATPLNTLSKAWISHADNILCVSNKQAKIIVGVIPQLTKKVSVLYNPLPKVPHIDKKIKNDPHARAFLYLGGDSFIKGVHVLIQASIKLLQYKKVKFILTKIESKKWRATFEKLNNSFRNAYLIFAKLPRRKLTRLWGQSVAFVLPSIWEEPLSYVLIESMLTGTLPIASRAGGMPEVVQGTFAEKTLFMPGNVKELVDRMEFVLSLSNEQLVDIGWNLRQQTLERFDETTLKKELLKVFSV